MSHCKRMDKCRLALFAIAGFISVMTAVALAPGDVAGNYVWQYRSCLHDNAQMEMPVVISVADESTGALRLSFGSYEAGAMFDSASGTIAFAPEQYLGYDVASRMDVYMYHGLWSDSGNSYLATPAEFVYDGRDFRLPEAETILVGNSSRGYLVLACANVFVSTAGLGMAVVEAPDVPVRYFRLDGVEVPSGPPAPGAYVRRQGARANIVIIH